MTADARPPRVGIVTGASRGIGQAICTALASGGSTVVGVARSDQSETRQAVERAGGRFVAMQRDLGSLDANGASTIVDEVVKQYGRLDVVVNNAGIIRRAPATQYSGADWADVIQTNLTSPFFLTQAAGRYWIDHGGSAKSDGRLKIVFIASLLSFQGGITVPAYAASKHGIAGLTKALANEWAKHRVNVNAIAPGYIETDNTAALRADTSRNDAILARIPEGRWGLPQDIAGTCAFLASPAADYVNGAVLNVDGGWLGR